MATVSKYNLDSSLLPKYRKIQDAEQFQRVTEGDFEPVRYLPSSSIRFWVNMEPEEYPLHWHPAVEIIMPLENDYTAIMGQDKYLLKPGDIFIIPSGELHHLVAPPEGIRLIFLFDYSVLSKIRGFSYLTPYISQPVLINREKYGSIYDKEAQLILKMCNDYFCDNNLRELVVYSHILDFFACYGSFHIAMDNQSSYDNSESIRNKDLMDKLGKVFNYMDEHFMDEITLEKAAYIAGFSKFHFTRLFKQCSGYNFYDYLCLRRVKSTEILLLKPNLSITEIALQSGFSSLSTFNRTFKRLKNCTPSEYRNLYNKGPHSL